MYRYREGDAYGLSGELLSSFFNAKKTERRTKKLYVDTNTIIAISSLMAAVAAIFTFIFAAYRWYLNQNKQDVDIKNLKKEMTLLCFCMSAVLDGLIQMDCNHTVPEAKNRLDKYLNQKAHSQEED